jgi:hypothetical protein
MRGVLRTKTSPGGSGDVPGSVEKGAAGTADGRCYAASFLISIFFGAPCGKRRVGIGLCRQAFGGTLCRPPHAGRGPARRRRRVRHRFTLRQTRRSLPIMFSIELVQTSGHCSSIGRSRRMTVRSRRGLRRSLRGNPGCLLLEPAGEIARQALGLVSIIEVRLGNSPRRTDAMQRLSAAR